MNLREVKHKSFNVKPTIVDRVISYFSPESGKQRLKARAQMQLFSSYAGASKTRRSVKEWNPGGNDADSDILPDLQTLRDRSRDLCRNNPLAGGAIKTKITNVVGSGIRLRSNIDHVALGMTEDQADEWEAKTEREWRLFFESKEADAARTLTGHDIVRQVYRQSKENGDVFVLLPRIQRKSVIYSLKLQVIEADRVCNPDHSQDTETL